MVSFYIFLLAKPGNLFRFTPVFFLFSILCSSLVNGQAISINSGSWFNSSTWASGNIPVAGEDVIISLNDSVTIGSGTEQVKDIIVNGTLHIRNLTASALLTNGSVTINGSLYNNGTFQMLTSGKSFNLNAGSFYIHNPKNNVIADELPFINGIETFDSTSTIIIKKWGNGFIPLGHTSRVTGNFGNIELSAPLSWSQQGYFSTNKIKGKLTVTDGNIIMDDGNAIASTSLTLRDVLITGNGSITFQTGFNRPYTLITGNFTDNSASATSTTIMNGSYGNLVFTVNGNLELGHSFSAVLGTYNETANAQVNVNGNFTINNGYVELVKQADSPLLINVTGITKITGSPGKVRFIDGNNGSLVFNTGYLTISGGNDISFLGGNLSVPKAKGSVLINIANDFIIDGSSNTIVGNSDTSVNKVRIITGRDFIMNGAGTFSGANTNGAFTFKTGRNFTITTGKFSGQANTANASVDSVIAGGDFIFNSSTASDYFKANSGSGNTFVNTSGNFKVLNSGTGTGQGVFGIFANNGTMNFSSGGSFIQNGGQFSGIYNGGGNLNFIANGSFDLNGGIFKGINNTLSATSGTINFTVNSIDYDGGFFSGFHASNNNASTGIFTVTNNCIINFTSSSDQFSFEGLPFVSPNNNSLQLTLSIFGNLSIGGANGTFVSSQSQGDERIYIYGDLLISNGINSFNSVQASGFPNGHSVNLSVGRNINISGGSTFLSAMSGNLAVNDTGSFSITAGTLSVKGGDGAATLNIRGGFNQSAGSFYFHNATNDGTSNIVTVNVNSDNDNSGDFIQSGGTINFDNCTIVPPAANSSNVNHVLNVLSPNYLIGPAGSMTSALPGSGLYFGNVNFTRSGTISFTRSGTHAIQQVKQSVYTNCTLDVISGDIQVASYNSPVFDLLSIQPNSTVALRGSRIFSNAVNAYSGILLYQNSRLRIQHPNGLYNNTAVAAISNAGNMNYFLDAGSIVEYYGTHNQVISGIGLGNATLFYHRYGILDINFGGIPDSEFVYPTNNPSANSVFVRTRLILTSGELNLDNDHNRFNGGGRILYISNDSTAAIIRSAGYVRSEITDGSGILKWLINSKTGQHIFPFGYNSSRYIPFTFDPSPGTSGEVSAATYHTDSNNLPLPPGITQMNTSAGINNSSNVPDRFWFLNVTGSVPSATLTFITTTEEMGSITNPIAQRWLPSILGWEPAQGSQSPIANGMIATGVTRFTNWWAMSGNFSPLPVELISFSGKCSGQTIDLSWSTASEVQNQSFIIERSKNGIDYLPVGKISGAGNSSIMHQYSFVDPVPQPGYNYYRLKQIDFNGNYKYYSTLAIADCNEKKHITIAVHANPDNRTDVYIHTPKQSNLLLTVFDLNGKELMKKNEDTGRGDILIQLDLSKFSAGVYMIRVEGDDDVVTKKFLLAPSE